MRNEELRVGHPRPNIRLISVPLAALSIRVRAEPSLAVYPKSSTILKFSEKLIKKCGIIPLLYQYGG